MKNIGPDIKQNDLSKIRHDINNNLTVISGYLDLLKLKLNKDSKESTWLETISKEVEKIKENVQDIR